MSTRSYIGLKRGNDIVAIYCHNDGHLNGVGRTLKDYYRDVSSIEKLISLGSISSLGPTIGVKVDFDKYVSFPETIKRDMNKEIFQTVAYHRDRGDDLIIQSCSSIEEYKSFIYEVNYLYLFENNKWKYLTYDMDNFEEF